MNWILVGYIAKPRQFESGWVSSWPNETGDGFSSSEPVDEICSVSHCIVRGIRNDEDPLGLYASPALAWEVVPSDQQAIQAMYAYYLWPVQFEEGEEEPINLWWEPEHAQPSESFVCLGWDVVQGGNASSFGCSPMSCNRGSLLVHSADMNRFCLVSSCEAALELARRFSIDQPEPGPYCVVAVWRDTKQHPVH